MRFIVKIGSSLLTKEDHSLNTDFIREITTQIARLHREGHEPILVTSGAVAAGRRSITLKKESKNIPYRQLLASVGQTFLLETYRDNFARDQIVIGQVLLSRKDFEDQKSFLSSRSTMELMLKHRVIPIVNENDVTTFDEFQFGNNDNLAAHLSALVNAQFLILLTDVEGLFDRNPQLHPDAKLIHSVSLITPEIKAMAQGKGSSKSRGGMLSKIEAAEYATQAGVRVWIGPGMLPNVLLDLIQTKASPENSELENQKGTHFDPQFTSREARRKWLQSQQKKNASLILDEGACLAILQKGKSLLPSGIVEVWGDFKRGDVVKLLTKKGEKIGFGQVNYSSQEIQQIKGHHSEKITPILGYSFEKEIVHRDNMVSKQAKIE